MGKCRSTARQRRRWRIVEQSPPAASRIQKRVAGADDHNPVYQDPANAEPPSSRVVDYYVSGCGDFISSVALLCAKSRSLPTPRTNVKLGINRMSMRCCEKHVQAEAGYGAAADRPYQRRSYCRSRAPRAPRWSVVSRGARSIRLDNRETLRGDERCDRHQLQGYRPTVTQECGERVVTASVAIGIDKRHGGRPQAPESSNSNSGKNAL